MNVVPAVQWTMTGGDGAARTGLLETPHGSAPTPLFMPVGTRAAVKTLTSDDLRELGAGVVLANAYHLMLRPGADIVEGLGGLHEFMGWGGPLLTDSGGFQVFSLSPHIDDEGATFRSIYDGSRVHMTPEGSVRVQERLGADIIMVLDVCVALPTPREVVELQMRRTLTWAERCLSAHRREGQALFGIVQGGVEPGLRAESARLTADMGFPGFGIGGLSVGETDQERSLALEAAIAELPPDRPRYLMGVGDTDGLLDAIARGVDMFDCVLPTRLARHGKALTADGDLSIRNSRFESDPRPLEEDCECPGCVGHSRAYLRHLFRLNEMTAHRLLTIHNVSYTLRLLEGARGAIAAGTLDDFMGSVRERRSRGSY